MPAGFYSGNFRQNSKGFGGSDTPREDYQDPLAAFWGIGHNAGLNRNKGSAGSDIVRQDLNQSDKEDKKDWHLKVVLISWLLSLLHTFSKAGVPGKLSRYSRGLHLHPSLTLQISLHFSIIYFA
jgi:hypothetical protein